MASTIFRASAAAGTPRAQSKALRRLAILQSATHLFAQHGYTRVSLEDIGAAVGVSGPAVYRHFATKQALLGSILLHASTHLLHGGENVIATTPRPEEQLRALIDFHVDFAVTDPDVIRVHDRELSNLTADDHRTVRHLQRAYVEHWVDVLCLLHPEPSRTEQRMRAHATFGLINSTPHSLQALAEKPSDMLTRTTLARMALAAVRG
ncbi:TetR/AcrR family transcriptional regulator [Microbacterium sp. YY-01]|uniref:TetR/AcrR family transcriptional regulator n=1 Tax=Microbacterium sp. YY-01 TaxID=3421634 RepID=UPI003D18404D